MAGDARKDKLTFLRPSDPPVEDLPRTFVDRYRDWAHSRTDAPIEFHVTLGAAVLSTILAPHVRLRTNKSLIIVPNLWVMVLAGTTLARKTTSLNMATRLLNDVVDDWILATDGSPEGIMTELGYREGRTSVFLRDEVAGFIESLNKDYMKDTLESMCKLYDGTPVSGVLRREKIEVKNPFFVVMSGGIKSAMEEMVSMQQIRSGFIPRFIICNGSTSPEQIQLIGPPDDDDNDEDISRDDLVTELWNINNHYARGEEEEPSIIKIAGITKLKGTPKPRVVSLKGTRAFWERYQQLQRDVMHMSSKTSFPELYGPLYDRLSMSIVKTAILLAGADMNGTIDTHHLQSALYYGQYWLQSTTDFAAYIEQRPEMDKWEKKAEKIVKWVNNMHPQPITQTDALQKFRIRKRDIDDIEATLVARGSITITPYPHKRDLSGTKVLYTVAENVPVAVNKIQREDTYRVTNGAEEGYAQTRRIPFPVSRDSDS